METYDTDYDEYEYTEHDEIDDYPEDEDGVDYLIYDDGYIEQEPRWTRRRVMLFMIALVMIVSVVIVLAAPLLQGIVSPQPAFIPPLATPASQL